MWLDLHSWIFALGQFLQAGGWVLYLILLISFILFTLLLERLFFRLLTYPQLLTRVQARQKKCVPEWQILSTRCDLDLALKSQFPLIKNLITLCPLIGLLGTVTGMIQVFDSLALYGTGNPRLMAAGVASATLPTMTGMAVAVLGLIFYNRLRRWSDSQRNQLKTSLGVNHALEALS